MNEHKRLAVIFGGRSGEHEVSLMSARSMLSVLEASDFEVTQIGVTPEGRWLGGGYTGKRRAQGRPDRPAYPGHGAGRAAPGRRLAPGRRHGDPR